MAPKRKAAVGSIPAVAEDDNAQAAKRRKVESEGTPSEDIPETPETTTATGLRFLEELKAARDKRNHLIATYFLELPDKKKIPQYYQEIGLPMSLNLIEAKLNRGDYPTMTPVESDLRRMVGNAKSFNQKSSMVFSDAEKIRKALVAFMTRNNPAYKNKDYVAAPTPVPEGWQDHLEKQEEPPEADAEGETDDEENPEEAPKEPLNELANELPRKPPTEHPEGTPQEPLKDYIKEPFEKPKTPAMVSGSSSAHASTSRRATSTPGVQDVEGAGESFEGDTFQQAQDKIITEMINLKNDDDLLISTPFINLPSRELKDYYRLIKRPVCLKSVQKAVKGIKGRDKPTGQTLLKSWQAFEEESSYIWNNAREYNEDESEISELAGILESYFTRRVAEARRVVQEPPQPKVKLRMPAKTPEPPKITLRFGGQRQQGPSGVSVDGEALRRQQDLVNAGAHGRVPVTGNWPAPPMPHRTSQDSNLSGSTEHAATNAVKKEVPIQSSTIGAVQINGDVTRSIEVRPSPGITSSGMPPPPGIGATPRLSSGSPHPQAMTFSSHVPSHHLSANTFDPRWRQPGKDASDALIPNLTVSTHPGLKLDRHFRLDVPPSPISTQKSVTIQLPSTHYFIRISPTLAPSLSHRPSKVFVTANMQRLSPIPQKPEEIDPRSPLYEIRLVPGVTRIEIEVVAGATRGAAKVGTGSDVEIEKIIVLVNLAKT